MCQALMEIMSEEVKEREDAAAIAATDATQRSDLRNLMEALNYTAEQAMDILKIPQEKRESLIANL